MFLLAKKYRLVKQKDFQRVFRRGKNCAEKFIIIKFFEPNGLKFSRLGIVVGLKIDKKAVKRNRIKRQLSEIIRMDWSDVRQGFDIVVLSKKEIMSANYEEIKKAARGVLRKAGILK